MRALLGGAMYPQLIELNTGTSTINIQDYYFDASGDKIAFKLFAPKAGELDKFEFRIASSGATVTNGIKISFQGVSPTTGNPDGTISAYRVVSGPFTGDQWVTPGLMTSDGTDSGTKLTVTNKQKLFVVLEFSSFVGGDFMSISVGSNVVHHNLYVDGFQFGVWTKDSGIAGIGALKYFDGTYPSIMSSVFPFKTLVNATVNTGTNPDEVGMRFAFPSDVRVDACRFRADMDNDCELRIYDSQFNELTQLRTTIDKDERFTPNQGTYYVPFPEEAQFAANEYYLAILRPTSASSITVPAYTVNSADMLSYSAGGNLWHWVQRQNDETTWTFDELKRPFFAFYITAINYAPNDWEVNG